MRWFGEPWPSADLRAPICDDDFYRVEPPPGNLCLGCGQPIIAGERGVLMGASIEIVGAFTMELMTADDEDDWPSYYPAVYTVVAEHIDCLVRATLGPDYEPPVQRVPR